MGECEPKRHQASRTANCHELSIVERLAWVPGPQPWPITVERGGDRPPLGRKRSRATDLPDMNVIGQGWRSRSDESPGTLNSGWGNNIQNMQQNRTRCMARRASGDPLE